MKRQSSFERFKSGLPYITRSIKKDLAKNAVERSAETIVEKTLELLGWNLDEEVEAQKNIGNNYFPDFLIKEPINIIIEVKRIGINLTNTHREQAKQYALHRGASYYAVTNGNKWELYHLGIPRRGKKLPFTDQIFSIELTDKKDATAQLLFLLSKESVKKGRLDNYYESVRACTAEKIISYLLDEKSISRLTKQIKDADGIRVDKAFLAQKLVSDVFCQDSINKSHLKQAESFK